MQQYAHHPLLMEAVKPSNPAMKTLNGVWVRTQYGPYHQEDANVLHELYPHLTARQIQKIAQCFNAPRLIEIVTIVEIVHRQIEESYTALPKRLWNGPPVSVNTFSVLTRLQDGHIMRVKSPETELMHHFGERIPLRAGGLKKLNTLLKTTFGIAMVFEHCCGGVTLPDEFLDHFLASPYYRLRQSVGNQFDSDTVAELGSHLMAPSIGQLPGYVLAGAVDFGEPEVDSFLRFSKAVKACASIARAINWENAHMEADVLFG